MKTISRPVPNLTILLKLGNLKGAKKVARDSLTASYMIILDLSVLLKEFKLLIL